MIVPEYGRCPICRSVSVVIVRTEQGGMCAGCAQVNENKKRFDKRLIGRKIKDFGELDMIMPEPCADDSAND